MYRTITTLLLALAAVGCGPSFELSTPPQFVEIDSEWSSYDYRATSANGVVIAVRAIEHDPHGDIAFWLQAIKNRMRDRGGYALLDEAPIKSADGVEGVRLRFGHDEEGGAPHLYHLSLFVTPSTIYVLEAGGTKELMSTHATDIEAAEKSFRTDA